MLESQHRFKAEINGQSYTLVGSETTEHMQAVTDLLNEQLEQLKDAMPNVSDEKQAILVAFNALSNQILMEQKQSQLNQKSEITE